MKKSNEPKKEKKTPQKLSPAEVWANAAKLLSKNKETPKKEDKPRTFDFTEIKQKIETIPTRECYLQNGLLNILDLETLKNLQKTHQDVKPWFPKTELTSFNGPEIYKKIDIDTLFYIFYSRKGNIQQLFAAKELKNYSWRFHTKYGTWFQRLEEPKIITEDYEQGVFLFFDYEQTWGNRKKKDFTFEYKYLENIEL